MGDQCNRDNYMGDRSSTRTHHHLAQHHSKSSWSFGWGNEETPAAAPSRTHAPVRQQQPAQAYQQQQPAQAYQQQPKEQVPANTPNAFPTAPAKHVSSNAYATGSNQNSGNFITDRPTTRVHAPPGGKSQITFG